MNASTLHIAAVIAAITGLMACTKDIAPSISIEGGNSITVPASGQTVRIGITTNMDDWTCTSSEPWISITQGKGFAQAAVSPNETYVSRTATLSFYAPATGNDRAGATVTVTQNARIFTPELSLDVRGSVEVPAEGSVITINVETNLPSWEVDFAESWLSGECSGNSFSISVEANPYEEDREAVVTVYAPDKALYEIMAKFAVVQKGLEVVYGLTDLNEDGVTSNSYVITHRGPYVFDATVCGNGRGCEGLSNPEGLSPKGASLVWQTKKGVITTVELTSEGKIRFEAGKEYGNALIAATGDDGKIIWSWHIWHPSGEIEEIESISGAKVMNFNLGALSSDYTSIDSYGLLYQWGRKDPFPGSPIMRGGNIYTKNVDVYDIDGGKVSITNTSMSNTVNNNLAFSIENPTACISNNAQYSTCRDWLKPSQSNPALWGNPKGSVRTDGEYSSKGTKTCFDPCPKGWRVPDIKTFIHLTSSGGYTWAVGESDGVMTFYDLNGEADFQALDFDGNGQLNLLDFTDGWWFYLDRNKRLYSYFPATTRYDGQYALLMGSMVGLWGNYWYNSPTLNTDGSDAYLACALSFGIKEYGKTDYTVTVSPLSNGSRADAYAIRCVKE